MRLVSFLAFVAAMSLQDSPAQSFDFEIDYQTPTLGYGGKIFLASASGDSYNTPTDIGPASYITFGGITMVWSQRTGYFQPLHIAWDFDTPGGLAVSMSWQEDLPGGAGYLRGGTTGTGQLAGRIDGATAVWGVGFGDYHDLNGIWVPVPEPKQGVVAGLGLSVLAFARVLKRRPSDLPLGQIRDRG